MRTDATRDEIDRLVTNLRIRKKASGNHLVADCVSPECLKPGHLYVNAETGLWDCKRCNASGNAFQLATLLGIRLRDRALVATASAVAMTGATPLPRLREAKGFNLATVTHACERLFIDDKGKPVLDYLHERGFDDETICRFKLCLMFLKEGGQTEPAVGIPYVSDGKVTLIKQRNLASTKAERKFRRIPVGAPSSLFNGDAVRGCTQAVLVEGELDAVSLYQFGVTNAASTSLGAQKNIPQEWAETLAAADDIVLWYDDDEVGDQATASLIQRLGSHRCRIASIPVEISDRLLEKTGKAPKDVNDLLRSGLVSSEEVRAIIASAKGIENQDVVHVSSFNDVLANEIDNAGTSLGIPTGWSNLDAFIKGIRRQELIVLTGHTAHGKTSFATALLDQISNIHKEPVLISSLENGPVSTARKLLQRKLGMPLSHIKTEQDRIDAHETLSETSVALTYVLNLYGLQKYDAIRDAFVYARKRLGVKYAVVDHLHFLAKDNSHQDEREFVDSAVLRFAALTRELDMAIVLLAHPRGSVELDTLPNGDSIKGSSSVKQAADLGLTVYRSLDLHSDPRPRKVNLKDSSGKKMSVMLAPNNSLVYCWKARHDEAREGACMFRFEARGLDFKEERMQTDQPQTTYGSPRPFADPFASSGEEQ
jgi:replicative DNA helicase